jgi:hypothetical protein
VRSVRLRNERLERRAGHVATPASELFGKRVGHLKPELHLSYDTAGRRRPMLTFHWQATGRDEASRSGFRGFGVGTAIVKNAPEQAVSYPFVPIAKLR